MGQETQAMDIRPVEIYPLVWWVQIWDFWFQPLCLCETQSRWTDDLCMCVPTMKHGGGVMVWGCFSGDTVCDLFRIQDPLNQHDYLSILQWYVIPSGLRLVFFNRAMNQNKFCIRWPGLHNHQPSTQLRWFGMSLTAEWRTSCQQVLSICGNSFKTVWKAFQVKLVETLPRVCKAVIKAKGGYFEESKIYLDLFTTFLVTTWFHMCYFIVVMSSLLFYNVENSQT